MGNKENILLISPPLFLTSYRKRWELLTINYNITALVPEKKAVFGYGSKEYISFKSCKSNGLQLDAVEVTSLYNTRYLIKNFMRILITCKPSYILCIHEEGIPQLLQSILYKIFYDFVFNKKTKLIYFSMKVHPRIRKLSSLKLKQFPKEIFNRIQWLFIKSFTDGVICHYPDIELQLINEGYEKPILIQTQYGVSSEQFKYRNLPELSKEVGLNSFTVGFVGRLTKEKGIWDIIHAVAELDNVQLLIVGDGTEKESICEYIKNNSLNDKIKMVGKVNHSEVQNYFNLFDLFYIGSYDSPIYVDTFPLVVAQAMLSKIPVIGSKSGAIPYQLDNVDILFNAGDKNKIMELIIKFKNDIKFREKITNNLYQRALNNFEVEVLNQNLIKYLTNLD